MATINYLFIICLSLVVVIASTDGAIAAINACDTGAKEYSTATYYIALLYMAVCLGYKQIKEASKRFAKNTKDSLAKLKTSKIKESNV